MRKDEWTDGSSWDEWEYESRAMPNPRQEADLRRLRRNKIDGVLGGVCAGVADYFGWSPIAVRVGFIGSVFFLGLPFFLYFIAWAVIPSDKRAPYVREVREVHRARRRQKKVAPKVPEPVIKPGSSLRDVKSKFRSVEERLQDLETSITSKEWQLRREFRDLEKG